MYSTFYGIGIILLSNRETKAIEEDADHDFASNIRVNFYDDAIYMSKPFSQRVDRSLFSRKLEGSKREIEPRLCWRRATLISR